jgi:DNA helicase-2/ATP-dependent DNA helicase PcrA
VYLFNGTVAARTTYDDAKMRPVPDAFAEALAAGVCTHEEIRRVLAFAFRDANVVAALRQHIAQSVRSLIVDEVFDANSLDIEVIKLVLATGVDVTLIGDPWQALYGFRGARPDLVPGLLSTANVSTLKLTKSFRWRTDEQAALADDLRGGRPVTLQTIVEEGIFSTGVDVVLAALWDDLWSAGRSVLPIAWGSAKGNIVESATTLLLNQVISILFGMKATYLADALSTLRIDEAELPSLEPGLTGVLELVDAANDRAQWNGAYDALVGVVSRVSHVGFPNAHANYTKRLKLLQPRLRAEGRVIPGMTIHQAKGREWDVVACRLSDTELMHLANGLSTANEKHRQLYVACTRARDLTLQLV